MNGLANGHSKASITYTPRPQALEDYDAERALIGAMLLDPAAQQLGFQLVQRDALQFALHSLVYDAMARLAAAGVAVDVVTVGSALKTAPEIEEVGGVRYIGDLIDACPSSANIRLYAMLVNESANQRRMKAAAESVLHALATGDTPATSRAVAALGMIEQQRSEPSERFRLQTWEDLKRRPRQGWMVEGLLLERTLAVMFGAGATFKSFMALDLALHIATDRTWHGHEVLAGPVVYAAGEGVDGLCARLDAWCNRYQVTALPNFRALTEVPRLCDEADVGHLVARLKSLPESPRLVIIDTLAWAMEGADENNTGDMTRAVSAAKRVRDALGCAVLIVHHTNKSGLLRGNEALRNNVDAMIEVRAQDRLLTLMCNKQKDRPDFEPMTFAGGVVEIEGGTSLVFESASAVPVGHRLTENEEKALMVLEEAMPEGLTAGCWNKNAQDKGVPERSFYRICKNLMGYDLVRKVGKLYQTVEDSI